MESSRASPDPGREGQASTDQTFTTRQDVKRDDCCANSTSHRFPGGQGGPGWSLRDIMPSLAYSAAMGDAVLSAEREEGGRRFAALLKGCGMLAEV